LTEIISSNFVALKEFVGYPISQSLNATMNYN